MSGILQTNAEAHSESSCGVERRRPPRPGDFTAGGEGTRPYRARLRPRRLALYRGISTLLRGPGHSDDPLDHLRCSSRASTRGPRRTGDDLLPLRERFSANGGSRGSIGGENHRSLQCPWWRISGAVGSPRERERVALRAVDPGGFPRTTEHGFEARLVDDRLRRSRHRFGSPVSVCGNPCS